MRRPELAEAMLTGWGTFLAPAAQRGRLIFGPSDGRNVAFVSPKAWLGRSVGRSDRDAAPADAALGRLVVRYLAVFPGATREMVARWWGGGQLSAVNRALKVVDDEVVRVDVEGSRGLVRREDLEVLTAASPCAGVRLLPGFDPFTNELPRKVESVLGAARHDLVHRTAGWVTPIVVVDGRIGGTWEIASNARELARVSAWGRWRRGARKELAAEVDRVAGFLDRRLKLEVNSA